MYRDKSKQLQARRDWYYKNKSKERSRIRARELEIRKWFAEYKSSLKCSMCPENHPACLQFHHRDPTTKDGEVSRMVSEGFGKDSIMIEIEKCDVLCANCHFKQHAPIV